MWRAIGTLPSEKIHCERNSATFRTEIGPEDCPQFSTTLSGRSQFFKLDEVEHKNGAAFLTGLIHARARRQISNPSTISVRFDLFDKRQTSSDSMQIMIAGDLPSKNTGSVCRSQAFTKIFILTDGTTFVKIRSDGVIFAKIKSDGVQSTFLTSGGLRLRKAEIIRSKCMRNDYDRVELIKSSFIFSAFYCGSFGDNRVITDSPSRSSFRHGSPSIEK